MIKMYFGLHVKCTLLSDFNETRIIWTVSKKMLKYKFHENPSSGSPVFLCGRTDRHEALDFRLSPYFECRMFSFGFFIPTCLWRWKRQRVPKRWQLNFIRRRTSQKKTYDIHYCSCYLLLPHPRDYSIPYPVPHHRFLNRCHTSYPLAYEDGIDSVFRNVGN
jgi:hypothetical protein